MISNMQNSMTGNLMHADERPPRALALCNMLQCGILRTFTRQPYFVQQVGFRILGFRVYLVQHCAAHCSLAQKVIARPLAH